MDSATRLFRSIAFDRFGSQILETAEVYKKGFFRKKKVFNDYQSSQAVARLIDEMQYVTSMWLQSFDTGVEEYAEFELVIRKMGEILYDDLVNEDGHN